MDKLKTTDWGLGNRFAVTVLLLLVSSAAASAQCLGSACVYSGDSVYRYDGNDIIAGLYDGVDGPNADNYEVCLEADLYLGATLLGEDGPCSGGEGGSIGETFGDTALPSSGAGPFVYDLEVDYYLYCDEDCEDGGESDGSEEYDVSVSRPTISGFCCDNSFWNLGPGSSDPQPTSGGGEYVQSVPLTFVSNCDVCDDDTPEWNLDGGDGQTTLSVSEDGYSATISAGSARGNCSYDSDLTANIDGFSTPDYYVAVNSPYQLVHMGYGGVPSELTEVWEDGYTTNWSFAIQDECMTSSLTAVPVAETFPTGTPAENGSSNYASPPGDSNPFWDIDDWASEYIFQDEIGQCCNGQTPAVTFTSASPPYTYNVVYLGGAHYLWAGTLDGGDGWLVYTGTIEYYRDHGDNTP